MKYSKILEKCALKKKLGEKWVINIDRTKEWQVDLCHFSPNFSQMSLLFKHVKKKLGEKWNKSTCHSFVLSIFITHFSPNFFFNAHFCNILLYFTSGIVKNINYIRSDGLCTDIVVVSGKRVHACLPHTWIFIQE